MATETNLGTVHVFPSEASFTTNSASVGASDLALVKYPEMDFVVESYRNGTEWYRKYKSGWVEQGGTTAITHAGNSSTTTQATLNLVTPMASSIYTVLLIPESSLTDAYAYRTGWHIISRTTSTFKIGVAGEQKASSLLWYACGMGA